MASAEPATTYAPQTVADNLHRQLRARIREGDFMPGESLSIRRLAQEYGTSIIPARDAVRNLVAEGALEFADSRRIIVPALDADRFNDVLFARRVLEAETAARAFRNFSAGDVARLREIDAEVDRAIRENDFRGYMKANHDFHFFVYRRAGSPTLLHLIEMLWLQFGPSMRFIFSRLGPVSIPQDYHRAALRALEAGDAEAFRTAIASDIDQGIGVLQQT